MNLYLEDIERVLATAKVHESLNRRFGKTPLCSMNAFDSNGNILGVIQSDEFGKTHFKLNGVGKK
jgi:hypothetical protein